MHFIHYTGYLKKSSLDHVSFRKMSSIYCDQIIINYCGISSRVGGPWLSISLPYRYYLSSEVSEVCINLKTNLLMPWHPEIFMRVKECPAYSARTKNLLFMHSTFGTKEYIHYSVSVKGYIQYQRVYSVPIKGYIQYKRVYSE